MTSGFLASPVCRAALVAGVLSCALSLPARAQTKDVFADGVEHWTMPTPPSGESYLSKTFGEIFNVVFTPKSTKPFGKSIAFLAGVRKYMYLPRNCPRCTMTSSKCGTSF